MHLDRTSVLLTFNREGPSRAFGRLLLLGGNPLLLRDQLPLLSHLLLLLPLFQVGKSKWVNWKRKRRLKPQGILEPRPPSLEELT